MSAIIVPRQGPRYGSAAELAAYAGVSIKTIRRLVGTGKVAGHKIGRRLVIPFDDLDRLIRGTGTLEPPAMSIATTPCPESIDPATGRLRPLTAEERKARSEALGRALEDIAGMTDETDTDEVWSEVMRGIDESRPHRPLFEGSY